MQESDRDFMKRAIELASRGAGLVSPNPMVGAVLVSEGRVVGEGYHLYERLKHAECYALEMAAERARGATLYCNLEPCCHHGRTPPCTDALVEAGIARAVIAIKDSDPRVSGRGISQLIAAGIRVELGLCQQEAARLNESYFKYVTTRSPFAHVVLCEENCEDRAEWEPSDSLAEMACSYDALILTSPAAGNRKVLRAAVSRRRHRELVVGCREPDIIEVEKIVTSAGCKAAILSLDDELDHVAAQDPSEQHSKSRSEQTGNPKESLKRSLTFIGQLLVTSSMIMQDRAEALASDDIQSIDKLTVVSHQPCLVSGARSTFTITPDLHIELEGVVSRRAGKLTEFTGYPVA
jgi:pyrimidine deaminase RibD-like protein